MRAHFLAFAVLLMVGCTTARPITPREYLDEKTAATITAVADPWIFNRDGAPPQLDFVHLYAIDVNRMGDHQKYLVVVKYWPAPDDARPSLTVHTANGELTLAPSVDEPRELGVGQRVDPSAPRPAKFWFYPIDKTELEAVSNAKDLTLALVEGQARASYVVWRDGSAALSEFAAVAQDW